MHVGVRVTAPEAQRVAQVGGRAERVARLGVCTSRRHQRLETIDVQGGIVEP